VNINPYTLHSLSLYMSTYCKKKREREMVLWTSSYSILFPFF
jgi:hypothetical protein